MKYPLKGYRVPVAFFCGNGWLYVNISKSVCESIILQIYGIIKKRSRLESIRVE
ncbi:hypothetical protein PARMER_02159 [Parabacteroides merdae ATCC 43184]|nr:hypothetical protein PARMER_02159 [Parabacteroides merdae ATCC 43184]